jgi:hypothetical protein
MSPFLLPYYRATTYSGDQIGLACCGDFDAALEATRRLLVGSRLAPSVTAGAVLPQATLVQRQLLPRFAQLFLREPHVANRYVNLLCFGRYFDPSAWEERAAAMTDEEAIEFERLWSKSPFTKRAAQLAASRG